ncbi:hypothetical protein HOF40_03535 [Candidatus Parcubacteria bacterium]|jgi:uncharacterized membrane protein|nr:hypothetical protein [Candidatus Parcubacteria bacterium]MBT3949133.1 hypothetical protein [Candidatus Parcubacteria bacterium]
MNNIYTIIFTLLTVSGIIDAGYLYYRYYKKTHGASFTCPLGQDCNAVVESKWGYFLGVKNEIWGLLYYISLFIGILIFLIMPNLISIMPLLLLGATGFGLLYSLFLTLVQIIKIKQYCLYCLISAGISLLLFLNSIALF